MPPVLDKPKISTIARAKAAGCHFATRKRYLSAECMWRSSANSMRLAAPEVPGLSLLRRSPCGKSQAGMSESAFGIDPRLLELRGVSVMACYFFPSICDMSVSSNWPVRDMFALCIGRLLCQGQLLET